MSDNPSNMGRTKLYQQAARIRFHEGTFEEIDKVLRPGEDRSDFVREAAVLLIKVRTNNPQLTAVDPAESVDEQLAAARALVEKMFKAFEVKLRRTSKLDKKA
jgi:hypothetical protein